MNRWCWQARREAGQGNLFSHFIWTMFPRCCHRPCSGCDLEQGRNDGPLAFRSCFALVEGRLSGHSLVMWQIELQVQGLLLRLWFTSRVNILNFPICWMELITAYVIYLCPEKLYLHSKIQEIFFCVWSLHLHKVLLFRMRPKSKYETHLCSIHVILVA